MSGKRLDWILSVFMKLDPQDKGYVSLSDLLSLFKVEKNDDVYFILI